MDESLAEEVRRRANYACEYCRMPSGFYPTVPFPFDHIIAHQHGGLTILNNLALSCLHRNSHKGPNISGIDPKSKKLTKLFNPRHHKWGRHFRWNGPYLVGRTAIGRVTIDVLPEAVEVRVSLLEEGAVLLAE
jgi:hypothetical protein